MLNSFLRNVDKINDDYLNRLYSKMINILQIAL